MKFNKYISVGVVAAMLGAGFTSCSEDFLGEKLTTEYSTQYFETPEGIQSLTLSLYGHIRWIGGYETQGYSAFMGGTDEFGGGTDQPNEMWTTYDVRMAPLWTTMNGNTGTNANIWDELYYGIASANKIIVSADKIADESVRKACLAQAYLLRGFNFYILTSQFGHCVLQTKPAAGVVRTFDLPTEQQCWEQIISDFRMAYDLFDGETNSLVGKPVSWTKATAGHFLAKALLFAASERNNSWNSAVKEAYLKEALDAASYTIGARQLENDVIDLYGNWTGENCDLEKSNEILMVAAQDKNFGGRTAARNPGAFFNPQFSNFSCGLNGQRGCITGGKDFQRHRPTEYTLSAFDNVNDARLWKSFGTVYGTAKDYKFATNKPGEVKAAERIGSDVLKIGTPSIVFIINKKNEHAYDKFNFGAAKYQENTNFVDEAGRLPKPGRVQERKGESTFGEKNLAIVDSWIMYKNGQFVGDQFGNVQTMAYGTKGNNMFPGVIKHTCGVLNAFAGDNGARDLIIARLGETYLIRAEIKVRLNDYAGAKQDIDALRKRGAWHQGENRSYFVDGCYEAAKTTSFIADNVANTAANDGWNMGMNSYYLSNPGLAVSYASTEAAMTNWDWNNLPAEDEAILAKLGVSGQFDRALNFILNEHTRELIGEFVRWEHLSRTKTIETRAVKLNPDVTQFDPKKHYVRPIPQTFLDQLQNADGTNLSDADKAAWQNPGY
ncbi:MAG: RagB/SusD family nutrient uptake outer membrane protein [Muribaculaceae bacterium]|nr:RagB/SusD family nutrient uptake outer membrane protein [Muribaculaceae bacterium]